MESTAQSRVFKYNIFFWKCLGLWSDETSGYCYKYYSVAFQSFYSGMFTFLYTLNLMFTPFDLEIIISQSMFYFTQWAQITKIAMIVLRRKYILRAFNMLDCTAFQGEDEETREIVNKNKCSYTNYWKACCVYYHIISLSIIILPIIKYFVNGTVIELPLCQYYFLGDNIREKYYKVLFAYQFTGIIMIMYSNLNTDTFINGFLMMAITQFKVLYWKLAHLDSSSLDQGVINEKDKEILMIDKLKQCLIHYDLILQYCNIIQDVMSFAIFGQFGTAAVTICVSMCFFLKPMTNEDLFITTFYLLAMIFQIFLPTYLGAELTEQSELIVTAAYNSDWIPRSESFKRSLGLLMERAKTPIVITGLKMFTLSLENFTSIMKMAYSLFTLLKNSQVEA
uniref:Odorant receptor n=1 Tax=Conogethes punctiferalis TaxID=1133088 RepID=A0A1X9PDC0_CONPF|nr:odorant receptor 56 [Conogethes punctiferalis]